MLKVVKKKTVQSGASTQLIEDYTNYHGSKFAYQPSTFARTPNKIETHWGINIDCIDFDDFQESFIVTKGVFVDEIQGASVRDVECLIDLSNQGYDVHVYGLSKMANNQTFNKPVWDLLEEHYTEMIIKTTKCQCGRRATCTKKLVDNGLDNEIGGVELYKPVCQSCWEI